MLTDETQVAINLLHANSHISHAKAFIKEVEKSNISITHEVNLDAMQKLTDNLNEISKYLENITNLSLKTLKESKK
jgi:hypothetical protein